MVSNSRHGTHSPFVYGLADAVIYRGGSKKYMRDHIRIRLLNEIADYLGTVYSLSQHDKVEANALYLDDVVTTKEELVKLQHRFQYIALDGIYKGRNNRSRWKSICQDERFVVTIDLFFFGLIFYRREQRKQNFKLRFPFWKYI